MPNGPASSSLTPLEQQILQSSMKVRQEMPDVANAPIEPMGWLDRFLGNIAGKIHGGTTLALAHGGKVGRVSYNPEAMADQAPHEIEDTLAHELTHVRQGRQRAAQPLLSRVGDYLTRIREGQLPYGQRPDELEAFQVEADRAAQEGRHPGPMPRFLSPGFREMGDIYLRPEKK